MNMEATSVALPKPPCVPIAVQAALDFLRWCTRDARPRLPFTRMQTEADDLAPEALACRSAALAMLKQYFECEMKFADTTPVRGVPEPNRSE